MVLLKDEGPKCPRCRIRAVQLLEIPIKGKIEKVCRACKKKYMIRHKLTVEMVEKMLSVMRK